MTTASTPAALAAFPKYPELPPELRLRVIEETLYYVTCIDGRHHANNAPRLSTYACINREWNRVVELRLFKNITIRMPWDGRDEIWKTNAMKKDVVDFGAICGKRSGRLSRIVLDLIHFRMTADSEYRNLSTLFHLFGLMKDWDHQNREQQGLIGLELACHFPVGLPSAMEHEDPHDLGKLPPVAVIGSIQESSPRSSTGSLHPCTMAALCQKLPNIHHTSLTLPPGPSERISKQNFIDSMDSLLVHKPGITHLDLRADYYAKGRDPDPSPKLLPIIQRLSASPSPWSDRLVSLEIRHNIVVQDFLRDASEMMWPNLKKLKLVGFVDFRLMDPESDMDEDDTNALIDETGISVIEALIAALPCMPKATKLHVKLLCFTRLRMKELRIRIHLGNIARAEKAGKILHCGDKFVPNSTNGVARVEGMELPAGLAAELQDIVRSHRRQELEVFACTDVWYSYRREPHCPCTQWNRRTGSWDQVFANDLDIFIYEMGQYWEEADT